MTDTTKPDVDVAVESDGNAKTPPEEKITADGGWRAPNEVTYPFLDWPSVAVRRGGISFTRTRPLKELSKKELRVEVKRLRKDNDRLYPRLRKAERRARRAERKVERLLKIIERSL